MPFGIDWVEQEVAHQQTVVALLGGCSAATKQCYHGLWVREHTCPNDVTRRRARHNTLPESEKGLPRQAERANNLPTAAWRHNGASNGNHVTIDRPTLCRRARCSRARAGATSVHCKATWPGDRAASRSARSSGNAPPRSEAKLSSPTSAPMRHPKRRPEAPRGAKSELGVSGGSSL